MPLTLTTQIEQVPRIHRKIVPALKRLGIKTVRDLIFHFPTRYEDFSNHKHAHDVEVNEIVTLQGRIQRISTVRTARKKMFLTEALIEDTTGRAKAIWFNQPFLARNLREGMLVNVSGRVVLGPKGLYLQNPAYEKIGNWELGEESLRPIHTAGLVAIYPETMGISSRWLRYLIKSSLDLRKTLVDSLPVETREKYGFPEIRDALWSVHFPNTLEEAERAKCRFAFENLLLIQFRALQERSRLKQHVAPAIPLDLYIVRQFVASLPFSLTHAQKRSIWEISQDLAKPKPMNRLLEGDVGSGKTIVAACAALLAAKAGFCTVMMAPTEILAGQHLETIARVLEPFHLQLGLLTGSEKLVDRDSKIIVGTHALIQKNVRFGNLGLVIVDEQHRFGVEQRRRLARNDTGCLPHFLSMTATPIPRTLALTIYGDLDISILDEMPRSRKPVITKVVEMGKREEAYQFIREEVQKGRQVFVVCPRIEITNHKSQITNKTQIPSPIRSGTKFQRSLLLTEVKSVKEEFKKLSENIFPDLRVRMLHGKMKPREKEMIMRGFKNRDFDILVATSVIEVGVDVSNATIMMIEGAEQWGLAQLHQLRGRVGRGAEQSYCFLFHGEDGVMTKRLQAVVEAKNGFELAEKDFKIRGPGDLFGIRQWGVPSEVAEGITDIKLVREVRKEAVEIVKRSPDLSRYPALRERLKEFRERVHLE